MERINSKTQLINIVLENIDKTIDYYRSILNDDFYALHCKNPSILKVFIKNLIYLKSMQKINLGFFNDNKITKEAFKSHFKNYSLNLLNNDLPIINLIRKIISKEEFLLSHYQKLYDIIDDEKLKETLFILINQQKLILEKITNEIIPALEQMFDVDIIDKIRVHSFKTA